VGVFDERIALTIPQETSAAGLPAYRIVDTLPGAERTNHDYFGLNRAGGLGVYRALGALDNVSNVSDVASDVHCAAGKPEHSQAITQSIAKFLKHEPGSPAIVRPGATGTGDLSQWRDWQTPTFEAAPTN
jgi:hypothetical protein